ncbi:MAG TPA: DinB family protein [Pyrinomonadaceae bacterium]|jgi:hypothetical protein|nr:DinB family protein [Pyrinomonadaceae bacterium]
MIYNSVDDVFMENEEVRRRLFAAVDGAGDGQARAAEGGWSIAEIVEHLSIAEAGMTRAIEALLNAPSQGDSERSASHSFAPFSLDEQAEQARGKIEAPEFLRPTGLRLSEGLARLKESRAALRAFRPRFESADYSRQRLHPAFGPLNAAQWLAFVGMHEARHLRQIERILREHQVL